GRFGTDATGASREHEITVSERGVVSVAGGKLTTYRAMSAEVVDVVTKELEQTERRSETARVALPGGDFDSLELETERALRETGTMERAEHLVHAYGSRWRRVWAPTRRDPSLTEPVVPGLPYTRAELAYGVCDEVALTLTDLLVRRTKIAFETRDHGRGAARTAVEIAGSLLRWDASAREAALGAYERDAERLFGIEEAGE
ncbi:MAG: glycerol-3-phosphate dehydrogenase, partial [Gemmatimonadaceae bacterium]|nr:glycerol-3-phosphate dehydrogenase [Gemmatimonadaceae bacterium]